MRDTTMWPCRSELALGAVMPKPTATAGLERRGDARAVAARGLVVAPPRWSLSSLSQSPQLPAPLTGRSDCPTFKAYSGQTCWSNGSRNSSRSSNPSLIASCCMAERRIAGVQEVDHPTISVDVFWQSAAKHLRAFSRSQCVVASHGPHERAVLT